MDRKGPGTALLVGLVLALALMTVLREQATDPRPPPASETAADQDTPITPPVPAAAGTAAGRARIQVETDPDTGRLRPPTPAQRRSLADALRHQFRSPPRAPGYFADGTISVVVATERLNFSVAQVNEHGLPETSCVSGLEQAVSVLETGGYTLPLRAEE